MELYPANAKKTREKSALVSHAFHNIHKEKKNQKEKDGGYVCLVLLSQSLALKTTEQRAYGELRKPYKKRTGQIVNSIDNLSKRENLESA